MSPGMIRNINSSNIGTVKAVSPCPGLHIVPFPINWLRIGPKDLTSRPNSWAMAPERWGPGPSWAIARIYFFCVGVSLSKRTKKKLWSRAAIA